MAFEELHHAVVSAVGDATGGSHFAILGIASRDENAAADGFDFKALLRQLRRINASLASLRRGCITAIRNRCSPGPCGLEDSTSFEIGRAHV